MKISITIEREDDDAEDENSTSMGISAEGVAPLDVFSLLVAGAEMVAYNEVYSSLVANGASEEQAEFGSPLRSRLMTIERVTTQPMTPYRWVHLDL